MDEEGKIFTIGSNAFGQLGNIPESDTFNELDDESIYQGWLDEASSFSHNLTAEQKSKHKDYLALAIGSGNVGLMEFF